MLCERCKKNMATVHYSQTINGEHREYNLCPACAQEEGLSGMSLFNLFPLSVKTTEKLHCPTCGSSLDFYERNGRFACPDCYTSFGDSVDAILKKIHGSSRHKGDMKSVPSELDTLKSKLKEAVENEKYEEAAKLRDKIKAIEGGEKK